MDYPSSSNPRPESAEVCRPTDEQSAIVIENLHKSYGGNQALKGISFSVKKGEIMGFLGPNGAGKSTTMNILTGYLAPGGGSIRIDGVDITQSPSEARRKIGYLPEIPPLYTDMTVREYLHFVYDLKAVKKADKTAHLRKIMEKVRIYDVRGRLIRNLSKGYRQRVGLAQALIGDPEVLVLDEPTVGLDPRQIMEIRDVISELGKNRTVILSTHILQEVSAVCDSYTIIHHGEIVSSGKMADLNRKNHNGCYRLQIKGSYDEAKAALLNTEGILSAEALPCDEAGTAELLIHVGVDSDYREAIFRCLAAADLPILSFETQRASLEETFMQIISGESPTIMKTEETAQGEANAQ